MSKRCASASSLSIKVVYCTTERWLIWQAAFCPTRTSSSSSRPTLTTFSAPNDLSAYGSVVAVEGTRHSLRVPKAHTPQVTARLLADLSVRDLTVEDPPIEDIIEQVFRHGAS